jgi:hypothetical protein
MSRMRTFLQKRFTDGDAGIGPDSIGLAQVTAGCLFGVFVAVGIFLLADLVGDLMLVVLGNLSVCALVALMPAVIYASIRSRKDRAYRYLAYGFVCLFATVQSLLLLFSGVFLSGLVFVFVVVIAICFTFFLPLIVKRAHGSRAWRVKPYILNGGLMRSCFLSTKQTRALYVCLSVLTVVFVVYFSTGFRAEWGGFAIVLTGLVLMMRYSREAVALNVYCLIRDLAAEQRRLEEMEK